MKLKKRSHLQTGSLSVYLCFSIVRDYPKICVNLLNGVE